MYNIKSIKLVKLKLILFVVVNMSYVGSCSVVPNHLVFVFCVHSLFGSEVGSDVPSAIFLSDFRPNLCMPFFSCPCVPQAQIISTSLTWLTERCLITCTTYEPPHYAVFSILPISSFSFHGPQHPLIQHPQFTFFP